MKLTAEQIKACLLEDGELDIDKLNDINKSIEGEVSKSYTSAVEKTKKEFESLVKPKDAEPPTQPKDNDHMEMVQTLKSELENLKKETDLAKKTQSEMLARDSFVKRAKESNVHKDIIDKLSTSTNIDAMEEFDFTPFSRLQVEDLKNPGMKSDDVEDKAKVNTMLKLARESRN
ncbi:MAG: hypothetical protein EHM25_00295 [Nitrosopumilales archaeon]|nr:MAG: hypothetical protein EHM25_12560 [Nitrosopumilales archaeon]RPJ31532.1 MAG: hypothetical protein EHM25_02545 [Nitrosopumilales archaeon]RPJ32725.1 MAG: hypothetical protein EHM25_00295 [Nitrosopumilales archaeon]